jgi:hypothetical protein
MNKGIKNSQMCKMWLKFAHIWPKTKGKKKLKPSCNWPTNLDANNKKKYMWLKCWIKNTKFPKKRKLIETFIQLT